MVHGYAGSGALLYKIFKGLSEHFKVVVVDIIGMGSSSRPKDFNYNEMTPQQSIDYFVDYLETWRKIMKLDKFVLAGHSFGGYVVGNYALKYHKHIVKLQLISPIGVRVQPSDESWEDRLASRSQNGNGPPKWVRPMVKYVW